MVDRAHLSKLVSRFIEAHADVLGPSLPDAESRYEEAQERARERSSSKYSRKGEFFFAPFSDNFVPNLFGSLDALPLNPHTFSAFIDLANRSFLYSLNMFTSHDDIQKEVKPIFPADGFPKLIHTFLRYNRYNSLESPNGFLIHIHNYLSRSILLKTRLGKLWPEITRPIAYSIAPFVRSVIVRHNIATFNVSREPLSQDEYPYYFGVPPTIEKSSTHEMSRSPETALDVTLDDRIHARVADFLVRLGQKYEDTTLYLEHGGKRMDVSKSIFGLLTLGLEKGSKVRFIAGGSHAAEVLGEIGEFKLGIPVFLPENSAISTPEPEPTVAPEQDDTALDAYMRMGEEIGEDHSSLFFMDFNVESPRAMIEAIDQIVRTNPKEQIPGFIDYVHKIGIFGKSANARHNAIATLMRHFNNNDEKYIPDSLTSVWIERQEYEDRLLLSFMNQSAMDGLLALFGGYARRHTKINIELLSNPDRDAGEGGAHGNGPSTPMGSAGRGPITPPTSMSRASMSPFVAGGHAMLGFRTLMSPGLRFIGANNFRPVL